VKSAWHKDEVEAQDEMKNVRLPSIGNHKENQEDEEEVQMGEKRLCTDYSQVEVKEIRENGVVMNDGKMERIGCLVWKRLEMARKVWIWRELPV
jgi:hypothetical protein